MCASILVFYIPRQTLASETRSVASGGEDTSQPLLWHMSISPGVAMQEPLIWIRMGGEGEEAMHLEGIRSKGELHAAHALELNPVVALCLRHLCKLVQQHGDDNLRFKGRDCHAECQRQYRI